MHPPATATVLRSRLLSRARLRHLHLFVKVAELQTVKRAAEAVGITQPSATLALLDLEQLLSCTLFLRHAQGMRLTQAGELLLPLARRMVGLVDQTATRAAEIGQGAVGVVRVAAISAAIGSHLGKALPAFARHRPDVLVELIEADAASHNGLVAQGDVDCAFCRRPAVLPAGWTFAPLWPDRFCIVAGTAHPLAGQARITMQDLLSYTWLVPPSAIAARAVFDTFFADVPQLLRHYSVLSTSTTLLWRLLNQEPLLSLVPLSVMQCFVEAGQLSEIAWAEPMPFDPIGLMTPESDHGPALASLLAFLHSGQAGSAGNAASTPRR